MLKTVAFVTQFLFDLYITIIVLRIIILSWTELSFQYPFTQLVVKLTQPFLGFLRRFIPQYARLDVGGILLLLVVVFIKFLVLSFLHVRFPNVLGLLILAIGNAISTFLNVFFFTVLLEVILSLIQPKESFARQFLNALTAPILNPIRRIMPKSASRDLSPLPALLALLLLVFFVADPIIHWGTNFAYG